MIHTITKVITPPTVKNDLCNFSGNRPFPALLQVAASNLQFLTLVSVISKPEFAPVARALNQTTSILTLFAPTNAAFAKLTGVNLTDATLVTALLQYHVLGINASSASLAPIQFVPTLSKNSNFIKLNGSAQSLGISRDHASAEEEEEESRILVCCNCFVIK